MTEEKCHQEEAYTNKIETLGPPAALAYHCRHADTRGPL